MLRITGADHIVIDETTETTGTLALEASGVVVVVDENLTENHSKNHSETHTETHSETLDATGCVVTPGLVNAHHHLLQSAFRTLPGTRGVIMSEWLPMMAAAYSRAGVDAELTHAAASIGIAESLLSGVTTVADHHLTWPPGADTVAIARATVDAARTLGGRLVFVRGSARDDPQEAAASAEAIVRALLPQAKAGATRAAANLAEKPTTPDTRNATITHHGTSTDGMLQLAVGPAGVHSDSRETFELMAEVAAKYGLQRRTQANEQVDVAIALERHGRRPIDLLEEWGWLAPGVTIAHLCDVTSDEIRRLAASGITATHAPGCDLPMGWGITPVAALRAAGIVVGLGTSGGGSNDAGHLLADARLAMQVAPLVGPPIPARQVLAMAMAGSGAGLGRPELGNLRPGSAADLCVWDVSGAADAGVADPIAGLLWASPGRRPRHVVVAGRIVVRDYELVTADERELVETLNTRLKKVSP